MRPLDLSHLPHVRDLLQTASVLDACNETPIARQTAKAAIRRMLDVLGASTAARLTVSEILDEDLEESAESDFDLAHRDGRIESTKPGDKP